MDLLSVVGGALLHRPCMVSKECVCCACDPILIKIYIYNPNKH